jgi:hypothetical protein
MSALSDYVQVITDAVAESAFASWKKSNPKEYTAWATFDSNVRKQTTDTLPPFSPCATEYAQMLRDIGKTYTDTLPAPTPPPPPSGNVVGQLGLYQLGGSLQSCSHLTDGTYAVVIGDWDDAPLLETCSGEKYAYTVSSAGVNDPSEFVILDSTGTYPNSLTPAEYIAKVVAYCKQYNLTGTFLDNCDSSVPNLVSDVTAVVEGLHANGLKFAVNAGSYISGNDGSDTGALWIAWAQQLDKIGVDRIMLENWQYAATYGNGVVRVYGDEWYQYWQLWQDCVAAVPNKIVAVMYGGTAETNGVYGRASMLVAPGVTDESTYVYNASNSDSDPYNEAWTKSDPDPQVNSTAGTATL